jgi:hypothetical protein
VPPEAPEQLLPQVMAELAALVQPVRPVPLADRAEWAALVAITPLVKPVTVALAAPVALAPWVSPRRRVRCPPTVPLAAPVVLVARVALRPPVRPVMVVLVARLAPVAMVALASTAFCTRLAALAAMAAWVAQVAPVVWPTVLAKPVTVAQAQRAVRPVTAAPGPRWVLPRTVRLPATVAPAAPAALAALPPSVAPTVAAALVARVLLAASAVRAAMRCPRESETPLVTAVRAETQALARPVAMPVTAEVRPVPPERLALVPVVALVALAVQVSPARLLGSRVETVASAATVATPPAPSTQAQAALAARPVPATSV